MVMRGTAVASLGGETYSHWTQKPHDDDTRIPALDMKPACENFIYAQRTPYELKKPKECPKNVSRIDMDAAKDSTHTANAPQECPKSTYQSCQGSPQEPSRAHGNRLVTLETAGKPSTIPKTNTESS